MKIEISNLGKVTNVGSSILRALQNNSMNELDLFVRESIQNSLDASIENRDLVIKIYEGEFSNKLFSSHLIGARENLMKKYGDERCRFLSIEDHNTVGLTGPLHHSDVKNNDYGNLIKLVYDIAKPQENEGSGGSWGYGKTIHYRIGIGLVVYYSRIKNGNLYEERLVVSLIENEKSKDTILEYQDYNRSGIAWWGEGINENETIPITDKDKIREFLKIFGFSPYEGEETGTRIIIPYINSEILLPQSVLEYKYDSISEYLIDSIQRWYFPRLNNNYYNIGKKNKLIVYVNDDKLDDYYERKYFQVLRNMYNTALTGNETFIKSYENIETKDVTVSSSAKLSKNLVGRLVYGRFKYDELGMYSIGDNLNPYNLSNVDSYERDRHSNSPIFLYTRKPGMIISYNTRNEWVSNIPPTRNDEYILGVFVLNSSDDNYFKNSQDRLTLEEYIRSGEKADHTGWFDRSITMKGTLTPHSPKIVTRIQRNISNTLRDFNTDKVDSKVTSVSSQISNLFGSNLLPPIGFGSSAKTRVIKKTNSKPTRTVKRSRGIKYSLNTNEAIIKDSKIAIPFQVENYNANIRKVQIEIKIEQDSKKMKIDDFEKEFNLESPLSLDKIKVHKNSSHLEIDININKTLLYNSKYEFEINFLEPWTNFDGLILIAFKDKHLTPIIEIRGEDNE